MKTSLTKNRMTQTQFSFMDNTKCRQIEPSIQPPLKVEPRPEVMAFARAMEEKLRKNDHKGGWEACGALYLGRLIIGEVVELLAALGVDEPTVRVMFVSALEEYDVSDVDDPQLEAADVGNISMMIFDNLVNGRIACQTPPKS